jgi:DNA-binding transcriptional ArsR family regulator
MHDPCESVDRVAVTCRRLVDRAIKPLLESLTMSSREAKDALFEAIASVGKAFGSSRRLELLDLLCQGPRTVDELARASEQSVANTSQHLQSLHAAGLVKRERQGLSVRYELSDDDVATLWLSLRDLAAERLAEVERAARNYLGAPVEAIARSELERRLDEGSVVLIDVRPAQEFEAGHIEGALSIPLDELDERTDDLPNDIELIAYCRGAFCAFASEAVRRLHAHNRAARRLEVGWPEWRLGESSRRQAGVAS